MLHDVFAVPFQTIAGLLDRLSAAAKKLASRARERLRRLHRLREDPGAQPRRAAEVAEETRRFTQLARAGVVMLIDGVAGIVIAPGGRAQALLQIGVGDHNRIHTIDITGGGDHLRRAVLTLPRRPSQNCHMPIGYQGHRK